MYAQIVIETKTDYIDTSFTYEAIPGTQIGSVVKVPFGAGNKLKTGYVIAMVETLPEEIKNLKKIDSIAEEVSLTKEMIETALFMKRRYLCRLIDGIECFLPSGHASKRGTKRIPLKDAALDIQNIKELTEEQKAALEKIETAIDSEKHEIFLLHGVTGSGKTEVYMQAIARTLEKGRNAIMLVPEISLTKQIIERFFGRFGRENVAVLHSKLSQGERYDEWQRIRKGEVRIVIGARSAVFAPLSDIGIVIMDEEHETSYKSDKTPKYETLEIAIKRLKSFNGALILGSATPSVVSYERARSGIYTLLTMKERYNAVPLPSVETVDMREELRAGNKTVLSRKLDEAIKKSLSQGKQVILFLNRRGYSTFISCRDCGYVLKCPECEISLTYHKAESAAVCHYCGRKVNIPKLCPECGSRHIRHFGTGTEKVEEFIRERYSDVAVDRLDLDAVKTKGALDKILGNFKSGKTKILIGTQLVAKGLDFRNVALVGIISADVALNIPDFRSPEKTFELITQASGRAGRGEERGRVIIQTYTPEHYAVVAASKQDFNSFFTQEIRLRRILSYPPYCDLMQLLFMSEDETTVQEMSRKAYEFLLNMAAADEKKFIYKPGPAAVRQESGKYRYQLLIKMPAGSRNKYAAMVNALKNAQIEEKRKNNKLNYTMIVDFNPYSLT